MASFRLNMTVEVSRGMNGRAPATITLSDDDGRFVARDEAAWHVWEPIGMVAHKIGERVGRLMATAVSGGAVPDEPAIDAERMVKYDDLVELLKRQVRSYNLSKRGYNDIIEQIKRQYQ